MNLDLVNDVDPIKAFFAVLLGGVLAAVMVYVYGSTIRPSLMTVLPKAA